MTNENKHALVVGGTGGIGTAVIDCLLDDGYKISATYFSGSTPVIGGVDFFELDARDEKNAIAVINAAQAQSGPISALVYAPGMPLKYNRFADLTWSDVENQMDAYAKGLFVMAQALRPKLRENPVRIVAIITEAVFDTPAPGARLFDYCVAKHAQFGLCQGLAAEFADFDSTVNMVSPGLMDTKMTAKLPAKMKEAVAASNPMRRLATPADVAEAVMFFLSPGAQNITGQNIFVNGGKGYVI